MEETVQRDSLDEIIARYSKHTRAIARRIYRNLPREKVELEDLVQVGLEGLMDAVKRYDPEKNDNFKNYAAIRINGHIIDYIRRECYNSRHYHKLRIKYEAAIDILRNQYLREPSEQDIATYVIEIMGVNEPVYNKFICSNKGNMTLSWTALGGDEEHIEEECLIKDGLDGKPAFDFVASREMNEIIFKAIDESLEQKEKFTIKNYYFNNLSMYEIGVFLDLCESRISQIHNAALAKLRYSLRVHKQDLLTYMQDMNNRLDERTKEFRFLAIGH